MVAIKHCPSTISFQLLSSSLLSNDPPNTIYSFTYLLWCFANMTPFIGWHISSSSDLDQRQILRLGSNLYDFHGRICLIHDLLLLILLLIEHAISCQIVLTIAITAIISWISNEYFLNFLLKPSQHLCVEYQNLMSNMIS